MIPRTIVVVVPGAFFDVDPGKRREGRPSRFRHHVRFSFGPPMGEVEKGLGRLGEMIRQSSTLKPRLILWKAVF